ncbi:MAG TPA: hypothetical protein VGO85_12020 [Caldimonas sp.]|jgi:hypothetical protein|nr:hypothetical protein [Caldimonas sp.]
MRFFPSFVPRVAVFACAAALAACASTDYHYSQLYGSRYLRTPIDTYPVTIVRVDGKDTLMRPALVDPGLRKVVVQGPPGAANHLGQEREISLDVRPCTRYYLVAVRPNKLASDFDVRIDYQEPVGGCTPPSAS